MFVANWVDFSEASNRPTNKEFAQHGPANDGAGWHVSWKSPCGERLKIPMHYPRECDAEMAANHLNDSGHWTPEMTESEAAIKIKKIGMKAFRRMLVEGLAW